MVQSAKARPDLADRLKKNTDDNTDLYSLMRNRHLSSQTIAIPTLSGGASSSSAGATTGFLKTAGDTMVGPIAYLPVAISINGSDELDISASPSSYVIASFATPDTIQLIAGAAFAGQQLWLQVPAGSVLTIQDYSNNVTGNIITSDGTDLVVTTTTDPVTFTLIFDVTLGPNGNTGGWVVLNAKAVTGGSGTASFPLAYSVDDQGNSSGTVTHSLTAPTAHKLQFTATGDCDITITGFGSGNSNAIDFYIEATQDGTGGHTITFNDSEIINPPTLSTTPDTTSLLACHADGDGNIRIVTLLNATPSTGAGEVFTWSADHSAADNNLTNLRALNFSGLGGTGTPTVPQLTVDSSGDMIANVATGDSLFVTVNDIEVLQIAESRLELRNVAQHGPDLILRNTDPTPIDHDLAGQVLYQGPDDAVTPNLITYGRLEFEMDDVSEGATQGTFAVWCRSDNTIQRIIDYSGGDGVFRFSTGVDVVRSNGITCDLGAASQPWVNYFGSGYLQLDETTAPATPPANTLRLYPKLSGGFSKLFYLQEDGTEVGPLGVAGSPSTLTSLSDVTITGTPADNEILAYNTGTGEWINQTASEAGLQDGVLLLTGGTMAGTINTNNNDVTNVKQLEFFHSHTITSSASNLTIDADDAGDRIFLAFAGADVTEFTNAEVDINDKTLRMSELSVAPSGVTSNAKIFCEDNGAGKTRLMVQFQTGSAQQIAIEP